MIDKKQYDETFVKQFTDFPLLVRTDTLKRLRAHEVFPDYKTRSREDGPSMKMQGLTDGAAREARRLRRVGREDERARRPSRATRSASAWRKTASIPPLEGTCKVKLARRQDRRVRDARGRSTRST